MTLAVVSSLQRWVSSSNTTRRIRWWRRRERSSIYVIRSMQRALPRPVLTRASKFYSASMDPAQALKRAAFGRSSNRYSSRNVDTRSRVTKDRSWRIAAKIVIKTFYLVSSRPLMACCSLVCLLHYCCCRQCLENETTVKCAIKTATATSMSSAARCILNISFLIRSCSQIT